MKTGISVYVGLDDYNITNTIKYLHNAKKLGCEYVFSSAHINEASSDLSDLQKIINVCNDIDLKLTLDISKPVYERINCLSDIYCLRLDYGFSEEEIIDFSNNADFLIELNASTLNFSKLERLLKNGLNAERTRLSYNFYPKLYTGHDIEDVYDKTKYFKSLGFSVYAFIASHTGFRPPMYEGLPSVETHRKMSLNKVVEELKLCQIDGVYFGDAYASNLELIEINNHRCDEVVLDLIINEDDENILELLSKDFVIRPDRNNLMLRLSGTRVKDELKPKTCVNRKRFDVTIDNDLFKRYKGEICIILKELPADERVNVIGYLDSTDFILNHLDRKFRFRIKKEG